MHLVVLISSTVKEDVGCNDVSPHKLELRDNLRVGFPRTNIILVFRLPLHLGNY